MQYAVMNDFKKEGDISEEVIERYKKQLPNAILDLWKEYGVGSFCNDYLKMIIPDEYQGIVKESYYDGDHAIPVMATGFGDIIVWKPKDDLMLLLLYRYQDLKALESGCTYFFEDLADPESVLNGRLRKKKYDKAIEMHGCLAYDECFGYVPLLGLGGRESVKNIQKVKIKEYIGQMIQMVGKIE